MLEKFFPPASDAADASLVFASLLSAGAAAAPLVAAADAAATAAAAAGLRFFPAGPVAAFAPPLAVPVRVGAHGGAASPLLCRSFSFPEDILRLLSVGAQGAHSLVLGDGTPLRL